MRIAAGAGFVRADNSGFAMSCSVTIQSVSATAQGSGSVLHVTVLASECTTLRLNAKCVGQNTSQIYSLTGAASETVTEDLAVPCPCGSIVEVTASCVDPVTQQPIPGCTAATPYYGPINCNDPCCIEPQITWVAGACDSNNQQPVTFTTLWNIPATLPSTCYPILGQLNFGNGSSVGQIQYITSPGVYPFSETYSYPAAISTTCQAQFIYTHPSCPPVPVTVAVGPCVPDCCPQITDVTINLGLCQSDCTRLVQITTTFLQPVGGCLAETLQWHFLDKNGSPITNVSSNAFLTSGTSPNVQNFIFDPALAPITAELVGLQYSNCADIERVIDIAPCDGPPSCPIIHSFSANVMGCENVGGKCLRRVEFTVDADMVAGCGASAGTTIEIDFGDGDQTQLQYNSSGQYTVVASHHYAGGDYQATLNILNPTQCLGQLIPVHVPACAPGDCNIDSPCPPLPKPPPWCYCVFCYIFSQKPHKAWCKAILALVALYIALTIVGVFMGWISFNFSSMVNSNGSIIWAAVFTWQNVLTSLVMIGLIPPLVWYPHVCSDCCGACALLLGLILGFIAVLILLIVGTLPTTPATLVPGIILLVVLFVTWLFSNNWCKKYAAQNLTADTWCKD